MQPLSTMVLRASLLTVINKEYIASASKRMHSRLKGVGPCTHVQPKNKFPSTNGKCVIVCMHVRRSVFDYVRLSGTLKSHRNSSASKLIFNRNTSRR